MAALGVLVTGILSVGIVIPPANAAAVAPGTPGPIGMLPSTAIGAAGAAPAGQAYTFAYSVVRAAAMQKAGDVAAIKAVQAGTQTMTEAQAVAALAKKLKVPLMKAAPLLKSVGGAAAAMSSYSFGTSIGGGLLSVVGVDANGVVCSGTGEDFVGQLTAFVAGQDCDAFHAAQNYAPNADASEGWSSGQVCYQGWCASLSGASLWTNTSTVSGAYCVSASTTTALPNFNIALVFGSDRPSWQGAQSASGQVLPANWNGWLPNAGAACKVSANGFITGSSTPAGWRDTHPSPPMPDGLRLVSQQTGATLGEAPVDETLGDPERFYKCTVKTVGGGMVSQNSPTFRESDADWAVPVCPEIGTAPFLSQQLDLCIVGGSCLTVQPETFATDEYQAAQELAPECSTSVCLLTLEKTGGIQCEVSPTECADWFEDPQKTEKYQCKYGGHAVELAECTVYAPTFKPGAIAQGTPYGDPVTGEPVKEPAADGSSDTDDGECFPSGWSALNPIEWVLKPTKCALKWAFVPRASKIQESQTRIENAWARTTPAKLGASVLAVVPALEALDDGGCEGITIDLGGVAPDILDLGTYHFMPACPGDFFAPWAPPVKVILSFGILVAGVVSIKAQASRFVGNGDA